MSRETLDPSNQDFLGEIVDRFARLAKEAREVYEGAKGIQLSEGFRPAYEKVLANLIQKEYSRPILPRPEDSVAVAMDQPKTAALFFDKVWTIPGAEDAVPEAVAVYTASDPEIWMNLLMSLSAVEGGINRAAATKAYLSRPDVQFAWIGTTEFAVALARLLAFHSGINAVPVYSSTTSLEQAYTPGKTDMLICAVEGANVIDESSLTWAQVIEVRRDK